MTYALMIRDFINSNQHLVAEYAAQTDKFLFVEYNVLDALDLPPAESLNDCAAIILEELAAK